MKPASLFLFALLATACAGPFTVVADGDHIAIHHRGRVLVETVRTSAMPRGEFGLAPKQSETTLPDGTRVWNRWSEDPETRIRQEIALAPDGSQVEISMLTSAKADHKYHDRLLDLFLPWERVQGLHYEGLNRDGRSWTPAQGDFRPDTPKRFSNAAWRYFALTDGKDFNVVFDLNPIGAGDYISGYSTGSIRGVWTIVRDGGRLRLGGGTTFPVRRGWGGGTSGAKVVIREGKMATDYPRHHALQSFSSYINPLPAQHVLSFGAIRHGNQFTSADDARYDARRGYGWLGTPSLRRHVASPEGAYYAAVCGKDATFRINGAIPGVHFVTVSSGNFTGLPNRFAVTVNGREAAPMQSVPKGKLQVVTIPVWCTDGVLDIQFRGDFLVSTIATQCLIAKAEDFSFNRGFWVSDGYEPGELFRSADYRPAARLAPSLYALDLPVPGQEAVGPARQPKRLVELPDAKAPQLAWIYHSNVTQMTGNSADLAEFSSPELTARFMENVKREGGNTVFISGMHSRHTYPAHLKRGVEAIRRYAAAAHAAGLKVLDHHDSTLLWNCDSGFRVMAERTPELLLNTVELTPSPQFCILNPVFIRTYRGYLLELVKAGVDALTVDELTFYRHGCGCRHCREAFFQDTGWRLPMNELDPRLNNLKDPLWKTYLAWRMVKLGNWWAQFRREAKAINPYLTICVDTTHYGFTSGYSTLGLGYDLTELARAINYLGTEIMTRNCLQSERSLLPYRKMKNLLRLAYGTPIWGYVYGSNDDTNYFGWAACNMTGQNGLLLTPTSPAEYIAFQGSPDNMDRASATSVTTVALLFSRYSRDWNPYGSMNPEFFGFAQVLERMHVFYDIIGEQSLTPQALAKYQALVLPNDTCLADADIAAVKDFAKNGGTVYLTTTSGMADEIGTPRKTWAFADVFGFQPAPPARPAIVRLADRPVELRGAPHSVLPRKPLAACAIAPAPPAEKILLYAFDKAGKATPALVKQPYGKGVFLYQSVAIASALFATEGAVGRPWTYDHDAPLEAFYRDRLDTASAAFCDCRISAPDQVHITLYRQGDALVLHFLNATGADIKAGETLSANAPANAWPAPAAPITIAIPCGFTPREVYAVSPDFQGRQPVRHLVKDGRVNIILPPALLKAYTLVWIR